MNYPVKAVLVQAEELIDMENEIHKFSVSWVTINVVKFPVLAFVNAWIFTRHGAKSHNLTT